MNDVARSAFFAGLLVVPEPLTVASARDADRVLTPRSLRSCLREAFAPEVALADVACSRLALTKVAPVVVNGDAFIGPIARRGRRAWLRVLDALDDALSATVGWEEPLLVVAQGHDATAARARLLAWLARAHADALREAGLVDPRREAELVADRVAHAEPADVARALGTVDVRARGIAHWSLSDLALWRVLDASLSRVGGRAAIELPLFDRPLDAERERDALELLAEAVASALDDAPLTVSIASPLAEVSSSLGSDPHARMEVRPAIGALGQGAAVAEAVHAALSRGVSPADVVVAVASEDEKSVRGIVSALTAADVIVEDARHVRRRVSNLVAAAELALDVAERGSPRSDVALLLRSPYVDPRALWGQEEVLSGRRMLGELARALDETPTAEGATSSERLAATVAASAVARRRGGLVLGQAALRVGQSLLRVTEAGTRGDHARAVRALWRDLGFGRDTSPSSFLRRPVEITAPSGGETEARPAPDGAVISTGRLSRASSGSRAELQGLAARSRDDEAWEAFTGSLDAYERAAIRLGILDAPTTLQAFRHDLQWVYSRAEPPAQSAVLAVRIVRLLDLAPDEARLVVVADADAASWPDARFRAELVSPELLDRLTEASDPALRPAVQAGPAAVVAQLALGTTRAERLVFTYLVRDDEGEGRSPAAVVASLGDRARTVAWRAGPVPQRPLSERDWMLSELSRRPERAHALAPDADRRARTERLREESFNAEIGDQHPLFPTLPRGEPFLSILTEETGGGSRPLAATATDGLAACVFKGFASDVVRARRPREAHDVADSRELGQIIHAGVEAAFRATAPLWAARPRDEEEVLRLGLLAAERVLAPERRGSALARAGAPAARKAVRAVLEWSLADLTWDFECAEQPFGEEGAWDAVVLEEHGVKLALRGRIDRVDVAHEGSAVRVIDYKRAASAHTAALGTTKFQLLLYGNAAQTGLARSRTEGLYLAAERLRSGAAPAGAEKKWAEAREVVSGMPGFERRLLSLVGQLRSGDLSVRPHSLGSCAHCDFDGVCRKPRFTPPAPTDDGGDPDEAR